MKTPEQLPSVAGRMEMTHADFQHACQVMLGRLQEDHLCDNRMVHLLCEAVRCSRECCELAVAPIQSDARAELEAENKALKLQVENLRQTSGLEYARKVEAEAHHLMTENKALRERLEKTDMAVAILRDALNKRDNCENCGGKGFSYVEIEGEAEPDPCECSHWADLVIESTATIDGITWIGEGWIPPCEASALRERAESAEAKLKSLSKIIDAAEKFNDASTDNQVAAAASLHEAIAYQQLEQIEDATDGAWLDAIAKCYHKLTGQPWDVLDGETSNEGRERNIAKLFQIIGEEREAKEKAEASFKERDLQMKAALEETESMFQRTQRAEIENVELREAKEKAEAACAEMRTLLTEARCDLIGDSLIVDWWQRKRRAMSSNFGQHLLDRMKAMEDILKDCQHLRSQVFPLACFPECPACRWEALNKATA